VTRIRAHAQAIVYNHAILSQWARGSYLMIIDVDEYLTSPTPLTLSQIFNGHIKASAAPIPTRTHRHRTA
jgi:hypothetical protein